MSMPYSYKYNTLKYSIKTTDRDLVHLSASAYHGVLDYELSQEGWIIVNVVNLKEACQGFYAFAARKNHDVVIAVRGTDSEEDMTSNFNLLMGMTPVQLKYAYMFTDRVMKSLNPKDNLLFTGHSLGAAIAQVLTLKYGFHSVNFDPPGITAFIDKLDDIDMNNKYQITIYVSAPNVINNVVRQIDTDSIYRIYVGEEKECTEGIVECTYRYIRAQHDINNLLEEFDDETGLPRNYVDINEDPESVVSNGIIGLARNVYDEYLANHLH